jgi:Ca-activated chloride channel family protein
MQAFRTLKTVTVVAVLGGAFLLVTGRVSLLTPDQQGYRYYEREEYEQAAIHFADPMWRGIALFQSGEFEKSAGVFAGYDTAESAFNQGNAVLMQGKYDQAAERYERATINRDIALARAAMLEQKGGEGTGGMLEADEIVFTKGKLPPSAGEEQTDGGQRASDEEMRAVWLRQVQTKPADFLAAKFAYQHAMRPAPDSPEDTQ